MVTLPACTNDIMTDYFYSQKQEIFVIFELKEKNGKFNPLSGSLEDTQREIGTKEAQTKIHLKYQR